MNIWSRNYFSHFIDILHIQEDEPQEDAKELQQGKPYHWRDWSIIRGRDCLYIWSDAAALELSNGSNGWFRFILDGKLATMYSSGSPEGGSDSSGNILFLLKCFTSFCNLGNLFFCLYFAVIVIEIAYPCDNRASFFNISRGKLNHESIS